MNKLQILYEYDKSFFDYSSITKDLWRDLVGDARKEFKIHFDLENDYTKKLQRVIIVPQDEWERIDCKFKCEMYAAGGDWEVPVLYFRCQTIKGYAYGHNTWSKSHFIFIPGKEEGNNHLWFKDDKWYAPDNNGYKKGIDPEPNERKCWDSLKKYLKMLVDKEIEKIRAERAERDLADKKYKEGEPQDDM